MSVPSSANDRRTARLLVSLVEHHGRSPDVVSGERDDEEMLMTSASGTWEVMQTHDISGAFTMDLEITLRDSPCSHSYAGEPDRTA